jgi:hypothetical protein
MTSEKCYIILHLKTIEETTVMRVGISSIQLWETKLSYEVI